jgi:hypothetical protein
LRILALFLAGCPDPDPPPPPESTFHLELMGLDPALLAIAPLGSDRLVVGGPLDGRGAPALFRRGDASWSPVSPPPGWVGAIWWSWSSSESDVWVVGDSGQIAHGSIDALAMVDGRTSTAAVFYGVWGSGPDDVYMVGGTPRSPAGPTGIIRRWNGAALEVIEPAGTASSALGVNLFKVWGSGPNDVMIVGGGGTAIAWDGDRWTKTVTNTTVQLTTVHGRGPFEKYAVGGASQGIVLQYDGFSWRDIGDPFAPPISGVFAASDGKLWVAGDSGYLAFFEGGAWTDVDTGIFTQFHAVEAAGADAFAAGGILSLSSDPRNGFVGRFGP